MYVDGSIGSSYAQPPPPELIDPQNRFRYGIREVRRSVGSYLKVSFGFFFMDLHTYENVDGGNTSGREGGREEDGLWNN